MTWATDTTEGVRLRLHIQPKASRTEVAGLHGDALKIRLAAPPVDGAANEELMRFLAQQLEVAKSRVNLLSGAASRAKHVAIQGLTAEQVRQLLKLG